TVTMNTSGHGQTPSLPINTAMHMSISGTQQMKKVWTGLRTRSMPRLHRGNMRLTTRKTQRLMGKTHGDIQPVSRPRVITGFTELNRMVCPEEKALKQMMVQLPFTELSLQ